MPANDHPHVMTPPPMLHLGGLLIGYSVDQVFGWQLPMTREYGHLFGPIALALTFPALILLVWTLLLFLRHRTTVMPHKAASYLITGGPFRLTRNPIYLSFALLHAATALSLSSPGMLAALVAVLFVMNRHVIAAEEAFHARQFGPTWQAYRDKVRRWL